MEVPRGASHKGVTSRAFCPALEYLPVSLSPLPSQLLPPGTQENPSLLQLAACPLPSSCPPPRLSEGPRAECSYKEPEAGLGADTGRGASAGCLLPVPSTRTSRCLSVFLTHLITQVAAARAFALPKSQAPVPPVAQASGLCLQKGCH